MQIVLTTPGGDLARYVFAVGGEETTVFAPYPPTAGELASLYAAAGGDTITAAPYVPELSSGLGQISRRQFFQQLAIVGVISQTEAEDAMSGVIPPEMLTLIGQIPQEAQFAARMLLRGATTFERSHPLSETFRQLFMWSAETLDLFWTDAGQL